MFLLLDLVFLLIRMSVVGVVVGGVMLMVFTLVLIGPSVGFLFSPWTTSDCSKG